MDWTERSIRTLCIRGRDVVEVAEDGMWWEPTTMEHGYTLARRLASRLREQAGHGSGGSGPGER